MASSSSSLQLGSEHPIEASVCYADSILTDDEHFNSIFGSLFINTSGSVDEKTEHKGEEKEPLKCLVSQSIAFKTNPVTFTMKSLGQYLKKPYLTKDQRDRSDAAMLILLSEILYSETAEKYNATFNCYVSNIESFSSFFGSIK